jgi:hypothetical protein
MASLFRCLLRFSAPLSARLTAFFAQSGLPEPLCREMVFAYLLWPAILRLQ